MLGRWFCQQNLLHYTTGDIDVKPFQSHLKDTELADLKYSNTLAAEKHMKQQEGLFGASGSVGT